MIYVVVSINPDNQEETISTANNYPQLQVLTRNLASHHAYSVYSMDRLGNKTLLHTGIAGN